MRKKASENQQSKAMARSGFSIVLSCAGIAHADDTSSLDIGLMRPWYKPDEAKFRCDYNCLSADQDSRSGTRPQRAGAFASRLTRKLAGRAVGAENRRELLGLADQRIDQRRQRVAMGHDQPDRMRDTRARRWEWRAPSRSGPAPRRASPASRSPISRCGHGRTARPPSSIRASAPRRRPPAAAIAR